MNSMNLAAYNRQRQKTFAQILRDKKIDVAFFEDTEGRRDPSLRYFTGHPSDALLVLTAEGQSILIPWDVNMAQEMATVDSILPYTDFGRTATNALSQVLKQLELPSTVTIELPPSLPYPIYEKYQQAINQALGNSKEIHLLCRENGVHQDAVNMRAIKDQYEIHCIKRASAITDNLILQLEEGVRSGAITTEMDAALLIERECRKAPR